MESPLYELLHTTTIGGLLNSDEKYWRQKRNKPIVTLDANTTIEEALDTLASNNVLAAPVYDSQNGGYLGFVDNTDVSAFILNAYMQNINANSKGEPFHWQDMGLESFNILAEKFASNSVRNIIDQSKMDAFLPVYISTTICELIDNVFSKGIHRAPVLDRNNHVISIISQSDIMQFMWENLSLLGPSLTHTLDELQLGTKGVVSMSNDSQAIRAYYLMMYHRVPAVAITTPDGELFSNLSATDIRGINRNNLGVLLQPVTHFLKGLQQPSVLMTCTNENTLEELIAMLANYNMHRVWVVDDLDRPVGIVSLTDVLRFFTTKKALTLSME